eukprot:6455036-Amphidinium_carterae.1
MAVRPATRYHCRLPNVLCAYHSRYGKKQRTLLASYIIEQGAQEQQQEHYQRRGRKAQTRASPFQSDGQVHQETQKQLNIAELLWQAFQQQTRVQETLNKLRTLWTLTMMCCSKWALTMKGMHGARPPHLISSKLQRMFAASFAL